MLTAHPSPVPGPTVPVDELDSLVEGWLLDCEYRRHSDQTLESRRRALSKLVWWLREKGHGSCGPNEIRGFLTYVSAPCPEGRWGHPRETGANRPGTAATYYSRLHAFFNWAQGEGYIPQSPMSRVKPPVNRPDQIQPFSEAPLELLLKAARRSDYPKRDEALLLFLLDTLCRASEVCSIRMEDVDLAGRQAFILGKGNKRRTVFWSPATGKALWRYLRDRERGPGEPLFVSEKGGELTRSGLRQLMERLGNAAKIQGVRCSPHTLRHTGAILLIRSGASAFALQAMLGHTDLKMTRRYVALADADVAEQHRQHSPVERLRGGRR